jgi:FAD/FMN-containing dehydrogenase
VEACPARLQRETIASDERFLYNRDDVEGKMDSSKVSPAAFPAGPVDGLRKAVRGEIITPSDARYDAARKVFNAMIDRRPGLVLRCAGAADVIAGIRFARDRDTAVSVRAGGHGVAGKAVCDGGVVIDLSAMKAIRVDPERRVAQAQPGLLLGEYDRETQAFGLATPLGIVSCTGISGLTLGGGIGWLNGKYGLTCDNVRAVDLVTANGELVHASSSENEDLYWAVRGGSGNFGVVTSFEYDAHPVGPVLGGMALFPASRASRILRFYIEFSSAAPDELSTAAALVTGPDGGLAVAVVVAYCGSPAEGEKLIAPLRALGPAADLIRVMPYVELQSILDGAFPQGNQHYWKAGFTVGLSDAAIEKVIEFMTAKPSPLTICYLQQLHGAAGRVKASATAFPHRGDRWEFAILAQWEASASGDANMRWANQFFQAVQPELAPGVYVNMLGEEGADRVRSAYAGNYERLLAVKRKYDPSNFFRSNHNIVP